MSLIGIDVGSSSVKAVVYDERGACLADAHVDLTPQHPQPGWWQQDPDEVWQAAASCMRRLAKSTAVQANPPTALAISASGREVFPIAADGTVLGPCLMGADIRGSEFEQIPAGAPHPEPWTLSCGHLRERMDPVFRIYWWRENHPEIAARARWFLGWHEFLTFRLTGQPVTDRSLAGRFLVYDIIRQDWEPDRLRQWDIDPATIARLGDWGEVIGPVKRELREEWGFPHEFVVAVGGHDVNCAALGAGVLEPGGACLVSGSYENLCIPSDRGLSGEMLKRGLSVTPHMGRSGLCIYVISPTGAAVLNWARDLLGLSIEDLDCQLRATDGAPSDVLAVPYLSGAMTYWEGGRRARGSLLGLTLATSRCDIVKAFMESIAYDHVNALSMLEPEGIDVGYIRATGGGSRSAWWTQLKADLTGIPIEVIPQAEPGTLGAALLAGFATGIYSSLAAGTEAVTRIERRYEPNPARSSMHSEKLDQYRQAIGALLEHVYQ